MNKPSRFSGSKIPQNIFVKQHFSKIMLNNRFLLSKALYRISGDNMHFGIEKQTKNHVIITSHTEFGFEKNSMSKYFNQLFSSLPIWSGKQFIRNNAYFFHVYLSKGVSLKQYLQNLEHIRPRHLHFILRNLLNFILKIHYKNFYLDYLDLRVLFLIQNQEELQRSLQLQLINLKTLRQVVDMKFKSYKSQNNQTQHQHNKRVRFITKPQPIPLSYKNDILLIVKAVQEYFMKIQRPKEYYEEIQYNSLSYILKFIVQSSQQNKFQINYKIDFIEEILQSQQQIINKAGIILRDVQKQAIYIVNTLMRIKKQQIEDMAIQLETKSKRISNQLQQFAQSDDDINECIQKYTLNLKENSFKKKEILEDNYNRKLQNNRMQQNKNNACSTIQNLNLVQLNLQNQYYLPQKGGQECF